MPADTMDKFISNMKLLDLIQAMKRIPESELRRGKLDRLLAEYRQLYGDRFVLGGFRNMGDSVDFVAVVKNRGSNGRYRTVLLKEVHIFGLSYLPLCDHMWVRYSKAWEKIEPFLQGQKVMLHGRVIEYDRADGEISYTVDAARVIKL